MPGTFSPPALVNDPDMHHGTCIAHVPWCMPRSLTSGFLWSRWRGKRSRHSRRMRNPQFCVSGKRPKYLLLTMLADFTSAHAPLHPYRTVRLAIWVIFGQSPGQLPIRLIPLQDWTFGRGALKHYRCHYILVYLRAISNFWIFVQPLLTLWTSRYPNVSEMTCDPPKVHPSYTFSASDSQKYRCFEGTSGVIARSTVRQWLPPKTLS